MGRVAGEPRFHLTEELAPSLHLALLPQGFEGARPSEDGILARPTRLQRVVRNDASGPGASASAGAGGPVGFRWIDSVLIGWRTRLATES
jgi:hypothetical protein